MPQSAGCSSSSPPSSSAPPTARVLALDCDARRTSWSRTWAAKRIAETPRRIIVSAESRWRRADVLVVIGIVSVVATIVLSFALDTLGAFGCLDAAAGGFFCGGGRGSTVAMWGLIAVPTLFDLAGVVVGVRRHSPSI